MELIKDFQIKDIVISEDFKNTTPGSEKINRAEQHYLQIGELPTNIVINDANILLDGYITYLLAVRYGVEQIDVYRGYVEIVEAIHGANRAKAYTWRVPMRLAGTIAVNDHVIVSSARGVKRVKVVNVIQRQYLDQSRHMKQVYKKC